MSKKNSNYTNENSKAFLIQKYKEANPTIPLINIINGINNNISTPEFSISNNSAYHNPGLYRLLMEKGVNPQKARDEEIDRYPKIPYIKDKEIRLTKGRFNTGKISTNLLDSIYDSSRRVGIPFEEALGLAGRESTLGIGRGFKEGNSISPTELMSNWQQVQTIYNSNSKIDRYDDIMDKYNKGISVSQDDIDFVEKFLDNSKKELDSTKAIKENPIDNALKIFKKGNYNRNDPNHTIMVKEDGRILMTEPNIQKWAKSRGIYSNGGIIRRMPNRLFTSKVPNYYSWGGDFKNALKGSFNFKDTFSGGGNVANMLKGGLASGLGSTVGNIAGGAIGGGLKSGAGSAISNIGGAIGGVVGTVNPILGGIISAGTGIVGGITNRMFGSKLNEEKISEVEGSNKAINTIMVDNSSSDSVMNQWANQDFGANFSKSDIGKDGWFSNKADNKYKELKKQQDIARNRALTSYEDAAEAADIQSDLNVLANFSAYGGPLGIWGGYGSSAIDYELAKENLDIKALNAANKSRITSLPNSFESPELNTFASGGSIHIKPENRGKFTEYCGGKVTSECIARGKRSKSAAVRKRATFAANARKFKHADGGPLLTHGGVWSNGVTTIDNGGSHEQNPFEGIQLGIDNNGVPNLVEEGEVVFNDYVFSNRLLADDNLLRTFNLPKSYKGHSFSYIAKKLSKESKERPNDPISKKGLLDSMTRLQQAQEIIRQQNQESQEGLKYAHGGKMGNLFDGTGGRLNKLKTYSNFTSLTDDSFYTPEYMNFWNWYNSNQDTPEGQDWLKRINSGEFGTIGGNTFTPQDIIRLSHDYKKGPVHNAFAAAARQYNMERPKNDAYTPYIKRWIRSKDDDGVWRIQPITDAEWNAAPEGRTYLMRNPNLREGNTTTSSRGDKDIYYDVIPEEVPVEPEGIIGDTDNNWLTKLRYAPVVGAAIGLGQNLLSEPDYSSAEEILDAAYQAGNYTPVDYNPIGNYLQYRPFDRNFYINKLNAQAGATRRAIMNTSSPSRNAALLAADYNAQDKLGDLARQAEEYNLAQRQKVEEFNRGTNMANSEMGLKAAMANQEAEARAKSSKLSGIAKAMAIKDAINERRGASMSANLTNLFDSLGNIGIDAYNRTDRDRLIRAGVFGTLSEKPQEWSNKRWEDYKKAVSGTGYRNGGKLKKKRGGFTY